MSSQIPSFMVDKYVNYDPLAEENSPHFLSKYFSEVSAYTFMESELNNLLPQNQPSSIKEELPQETLNEQFSHGSAYSTNPSTKHSPEYTPDDEDQEGDNDKFVPSRVPPITRKGIKKQYEPILDNGILYRYEEDPNEYRRARKRIQNRESATRVRYRKRTRAEELEDEVKQLTVEKSELQIQNATLVAENTMLKQQVGLLEKMVTRGNQEDVMDNTDSFNEGMKTEPSESIINLNDELESQQGAPRFKYTRVSPAHTFKKHVATLGVFTLLLCVYGLLPRTESRTVQLFTFTKSVLSRPNSLAFGIKTAVGAQDLAGNLRGGIPGENPISWAWLIEFLVMVVCYFGYSIYVGVKFYKQRELRKTGYAYTPL